MGLTSWVKNNAVALAILGVVIYAAANIKIEQTQNQYQYQDQRQDQSQWQGWFNGIPIENLKTTLKFFRFECKKMLGCHITEKLQYFKPEISKLQDKLFLQFEIEGNLLIISYLEFERKKDK